MATCSTVRRRQPWGPEHAGLFLISINPAWRLIELSRQKLLEKESKGPKLTLPY